MKKLLMIMMAAVVACGTVMAADQPTAKELRKERQEIQKMAKKDLKAKVDKNTRKEAKRLKKEGWQVKPGALPLEKQLERAYLMQY